MYTSNLRKVGGSVMLAVPPAILNLVQLQSGSTVSISVENGRMVVEPESATRYSLQDLLDQCDLSAPMPESDDNQWTASAPQGRELI